jgi:hypothetical protein
VVVIAETVVIVAIDGIEVLWRFAIDLRGATHGEAIEREADDLARLVFRQHRRGAMVVILMPEAGVVAVRIERGDVLKRGDTMHRLRREKAHPIRADAHA